LFYYIFYYVKNDFEKYYYIRRVKPKRTKKREGITTRIHHEQDDIRVESRTPQ
jgi:hypothetical protein